MYDEKTKKYTVIDWTHCTYGPKLLDIAALLREQRERTCSFSEMEEMLLSKVDASDEYDTIDKLLFLYASIVVSLLLNRRSIIQEDTDFFSLPAVLKCEELVKAIVATNQAKKISNHL